MTRRRLSRCVAIFVTSAVAVLGLQLIGGSTPVGAATVSFPCDGVTGDTAGTVSGAPKSSKDIVALLGSKLNLPVDIAVVAPAKVKKGDDPIGVRFDATVKFDPALVNQIKNLLKKDKITVRNAQFSFKANYSDGSSSTISGALPEQVIDLNAGSPPPLSVSGTVVPNKQGQIIYTAGPLSISVVIDGEVAGVAKIGTLSLTCSPPADELATTVVQVPGAPNIANIRIRTNAGISAHNLQSSWGLITPDEGNPILWDTLRVTGGSGSIWAKVDTGRLNVLAPAGSHRVNMEVCGASRMTPFVEGADEVQQLAFGEDYNTVAARQGLNAHPLGMKLKVGDKETGIIPLSYAKDDPVAKLIHGDGPTPVENANVVTQILTSRFVPPAPGVIQAALAAVLGEGEVVVTGGPLGGNPWNTPYEIRFADSLRRTNVPEVTVSKWYSFLDFSLKATVLDQATKVGQPTPGAPPDPFKDFNQEQLNNALLAGQLSFDAWFGKTLQKGLLDPILKDPTPILNFLNDIFPPPPSAKTMANGKADELPAPTGLLCTPFSVSMEMAPVAVAGACTVRKTFTTRVKVRVNGKTRYVHRRVTRNVPCPKPKATTTKKSSKRR